MKICQYCGSPCQDSDMECRGCGAREFHSLCPNCGNVVKEGRYCPRCGVRMDQKPRSCPRCGTSYFSNACPNCGYLEGRVETIPEPDYQPDPMPLPTYSAPSRRIGCGTILLWIFFFPIMLLVTIWRSRLPLAVKILLTLGWMLFLFSYSFSASTAPTGYAGYTLAGYFG